MDFNEKNIKLLLEKKLCIDFIDIKLIRQDDESNIYKGCGSITQDSEGLLQLKVYRPIKDERYTPYIHEGDHEVGKIIPKKRYYKLEATDLTGTQWTAENILVPNRFIDGAGEILNLDVCSLSCQKKEENLEAPELASSTVIIPGKFDFPCNKKEETERSVRWNICSFRAQGVDIEIVNRDHFMILRFCGLANICNEDFIKRTIQALSIAIGRKCLILAVLTNKKKKQLIILNRTKPIDQNIRLLQPFDSRFIASTEDFIDFITCYLGAFDKPYCEFYVFWERIAYATGEIQNQCLITTVAIEGLVKTHYRSTFTPNEKQINFFKRALTKIKNFDFDQETSHLLCSFLSSKINGQSKHWKNALRNLSDKNLFDSSIILTYEKRRNSSAHGELINDTDEKYQEVLDDFFKCLRIFYALLLDTINYHGERIDMSVPGWPNIKEGYDPKK